MNLFDIANIQRELEKVEKLISNEDFWQKDSSETAKVLSMQKQLKRKIDKYTNIKNELENVSDLIELAIIENDDTIAKDINKTINNLEEQIEKLQLETLLFGKYDKNKAILR